MHPQNFSIRTINLRMPHQLVLQVDDLAGRNFTSRSEIIRIALLEYLRKPANMPSSNDNPGQDSELAQVVEEFRAIIDG